MSFSAVHVVSHNVEQAEALKSALSGEGVALATDPAHAPSLGVAIVDRSPWTEGQAMLSEQISQVVVFSTDGTASVDGGERDGVIVMPWNGVESAVVTIVGMIRGGDTPGDEFAEVDDVSDVEDEADIVEDVEPALTATPPPPRSQLLAKLDLPEITPEDREFVSRVFHQVRDVDFRSSPPPPPRKGLGGVDKKMATLRYRVGELERDLARVGFVWNTKQKEVEAVEQIIHNKEQERQQALTRYEQIRDQATKAASQHHGEADTLRSSVAQLESQKSALEKQLAELRQKHEYMSVDLHGRIVKLEQERNNLVSDFRNKIEAAQTAFYQLKEGSTRAISDAESRAKGLELELGHARQTIGEREARISELTNDLAATHADLEGRLLALQNELTTSQQSRESVIGRLAERDKSFSSMADELAHVRIEREGRLNDLATQLAAAKIEVESSKRDLLNRDALLSEREKSLTALADEFTKVRQEFEERKTELRQQLEDMQAKVANYERELNELRATVRPTAAGT